jgi:hypothetical protein
MVGGTMSKSIPKQPWINHTKEVILQIAKEHGMDENVFIKEIKLANYNGPFKPANWDKYIKVILNWEFFNRSRKSPPPPPCPVCGAAQFHDQELVGLYRLTSYSGLRCEKNKHHFYMVLEALRLKDLGKMEFEQALQLQKEKELA